MNTKQIGVVKELKQKVLSLQSSCHMIIALGQMVPILSIDNIPNSNPIFFSFFFFADHTMIQRELALE